MRWPAKAKDEDLDAVEDTVLSRINQTGERLSSGHMKDRLNLLQWYLRVRIASYTEAEGAAWLENRPIPPRVVRRERSVAWVRSDEFEYPDFLWLTEDGCWDFFSYLTPR